MYPTINNLIKGRFDKLAVSRVEQFINVNGLRPRVYVTDMLSDTFTHAVYDIALNVRVFVGQEDACHEFEFNSDRYYTMRVK